MKVGEIFEIGFRKIIFFFTKCMFFNRPLFAFSKLRFFSLLCRISMSFFEMMRLPFRNLLNEITICKANQNSFEFSETYPFFSDFNDFRWFKTSARWTWTILTGRNTRSASSRPTPIRSPEFEISIFFNNQMFGFLLFIIIFQVIFYDIIIPYSSKSWSSLFPLGISFRKLLKFLPTLLFE